MNKCDAPSPLLVGSFPCPLPLPFRYGVSVDLNARVPRSLNSRKRKERGGKGELNAFTAEEDSRARAHLHHTSAQFLEKGKLSA